MTGKFCAYCGEPLPENRVKFCSQIHRTYFQQDEADRAKKTAESRFSDAMAGRRFQDDAKAVAGRF